MSFTDLTFLFGFLPIVWVLYPFVFRTRFANLYLVIVSLIFYAWGSLTSLLVLLVVLGWNFTSARIIAATQEEHARRRQVIITVAIDLAILCFYRYLPALGFLDTTLSTRFGSLGAMMPIGLSFYLFSCLSCVFDVYRQKTFAPASVTDFALFAAFFGRVNMGPIGHWAQFEPQLKNHPQTRAKSAQGTTLFVQGLFRKVVLADNFALVYAALSGNTSWLGNLLFGFAYFFQLYFDFSGYSRMARGVASLFGFEIPKNFDLPYTALSNQDFWRRWHISLTSWFRNYVYIPLGGNRVCRQRWMINVLIVWLLTGIWHGASWTFMLWGLLQGGLILMEQTWLKGRLERWPVWLQHLYVVFSQLVGWTLFSSASALAAFGVIGRYFGIGISGFADPASLFVLGESLILLLIAILLASGWSVLLGRVARAMAKKAAFGLQAAGYAAELIVCICFLVSASAQTFLYAVF